MVKNNVLVKITNFLSYEQHFYYTNKIIHITFMHIRHAIFKLNSPTGVQKNGTAGTGGAGQTTFGWTK